MKAVCDEIREKGGAYALCLHRNFILSLNFRRFPWHDAIKASRKYIDKKSKANLNSKASC